jgi:hypothetical protein
MLSSEQVHGTGSDMGSGRYFITLGIVDVGQIDAIAELCSKLHTSCGEHIVPSFDSVRRPGSIVLIR